MFLYLRRYKISTSSGGGYCDCGDEEAWKSDKYCSLHQPKVEEGPDDRTLKPVELECRAKFLLNVLLDYAYKLLTFELTLSVPPDLEFGDEETNRLPELIKCFVDDELYCTVLYNDETHTFDTVISTLQRALECNQREAVDYATMIDREGRCVVKIDQFQVRISVIIMLIFSTLMLLNCVNIGDFSFAAMLPS